MYAFITLSSLYTLFKVNIASFFYKGENWHTEKLVSI